MAKAIIPGKALRGFPEYGVWNTMRSRCYNPRVERYPNYGGRGIQVCERWRKSFADFLADMGRRPSSQHQLERIDNDGNYEPGNVRWALPTENARNRRSSRLIVHAGETLTLAEWAERTGLKVATIWARLKMGWSVADALTVPRLRQWSRRKRC
jgi:hypothetical protein